MNLKLNENGSHHVRNILFKKNKREKKSGRQEVPDVVKKTKETRQFREKGNLC